MNPIRRTLMVVSTAGDTVDTTAPNDTGRRYVLGDIHAVATDGDVEVAFPIEPQTIRVGDRVVVTIEREEA